VGQQYARSPLTPQHCNALISGTSMRPPSRSWRGLGSRAPVAKVHAPPAQHDRHTSASTFATHRYACAVRWHTCVSLGQHIDATESPDSKPPPRWWWWLPPAPHSVCEGAQGDAWTLTASSVVVKTSSNRQRRIVIVALQICNLQPATEQFRAARGR
jgi:hypothetical protein